MLKALATGVRDGQALKLVVLGLSHVNLARLKEGRPIIFDGAEVGWAGTEVVIFAGASEQSMARDLNELIGPQTQVRIDPRLRD